MIVTDRGKFWKGLPGGCGRLLLPFAALLVAEPSRAQDLDPEDLSPYSEMELIVEPASARSGEDFTVVLRIALEPGWHTYWLNGGDAGLPIVVAWDLPSGFQAAPLEFPVPKRIPRHP